MHEHLTGGPCVHALLQRVPNVSGPNGIENSSFGHFYHRMTGHDWPTPLTTCWCGRGASSHVTRAPNSQCSKGKSHCSAWSRSWKSCSSSGTRSRSFPFKAENWFHNRTPSCLREAAIVAATYRNLSHDATEALISEFLDYAECPWQARRLNRFRPFCTVSFQS